jgi:hypothetical protein
MSTSDDDLCVRTKLLFDYWERLTIQQQEEIDFAISELDSGLGIIHDEVMAKYKGKYI